jgi:hypothetical protein
MAAGNSGTEFDMKRSTASLLILLGLAAGCASSGERSTQTALPPAPPETVATPQWAMGSLTVGELLAKGGRQLNGAQVKSVVTGTVMEGLDGDSTWREMSFPDGKVTGQTTMRGGLVIDYEGTWWMDEQGRRCWTNSRQQSPAAACVHLYHLDGRYYAAESDASRKNARLEPRRIRK